MKPVETLIRYLLIIEHLQSCKRVPTQQLIDHVNNEMEMRGFRTVSLRTLQRDFSVIETDFGYTITSNGREYTIKRASGYVSHRFDEILLDFDLLTALNSDVQLQQFILAEHHRPVGCHLKHPLIRAIKQTHTVEFDYVLYRLGRLTHKTVQPHFLKESNQRWYLLAKEHDTLKCFGLDRILQLKVHTNNQFVRDESIDADTLFRDSYGIWDDPAIPIENIELSYDALDGCFLKSVPLHHSQQILVDTPQEFRITLRLRITNDFIMELLSRSRSITVIRPISLRERIKKIYEEALKRNQIN